MKLGRWLGTVAMVALSTPGAYSQGLKLDAVYGLLMKVATAPTEVSYVGMVRTEFVDGTTTRTVEVKIQHQTDGRDRVTVIKPEREAGRVFVRDGADHGHRRENGPLSLGLSGVKSRVGSDLALLLTNYALTAVDGASIDGRTTFRIDIQPKYAGRKSKELWVDRQTGIVLKSVVRLPSGGRTVRTEFTSIRLTPDSWSLPEGEQRALAVPRAEIGTVENSQHWLGVIDTAELTELTALEKRERFPLLSPGYLPAGFVMEQVREFPAPNDSHRQVVHILYSDGLSSISLFMQQQPPFWPNRVRSFLFGERHSDRHHPGDHGVSVAAGTRNGTRYVLVSDVTNATLSKMADSLSPIH